MYNSIHYIIAVFGFKGKLTIIDVNVVQNLMTYGLATNFIMKLRFQHILCLILHAINTTNQMTNNTSDIYVSFTEDNTYKMQ